MTQIPLILITIIVVALLIYVFYHMFRYDAFQNHSIPKHIKDHSQDGIMMDQLNNVDRIVLTRTQARRMQREAKKNPKLKHLFKDQTKSNV